MEVIDAVLSRPRRLDLMLKGHAALQAEHGVAVVRSHVQDLDLHSPFHADSIFRNRAVVYLDLPAAMAELENRRLLAPGLQPFRHTAFGSVAHQKTFILHRRHRRGNLKSGMIEIADHIQLLFLVDADIQLQNRINIYDPQLSVVVGLDLQIRICQLQLQASQHSLLAAAHIHPAVERKHLFQPACLRTLFPFIQQEDYQLALHHHFSLCEAQLRSLHRYILPDHLPDVRLIGRKNDLVLDPAGVALPDCQGSGRQRTGLHLRSFRPFHGYGYFLIFQLFHGQLQRRHRLDAEFP